MESIIEYLLKSAGVLSIFVLVYHFLLRRLTFFNANRWFLLAGIVASIIFPLIEITQTVYVEQPEQILYLPQQVATPMALVLEQPAVDATPFDYSMLAIYVYLAISMFFLGKMMVELSSLHRLIKSGNRKKVGNYIFVTLSRKLTPFSFFNYICYSESDQQSAELDLIIDHEKVHARQWHSIDLLASHIFRAVFWINPLVWLLKKQIGENLEFIADSKAKIQNTSGISYERTLLSTAASHMQPALANNFFTPFIKKRIMMLQKEASAQWNAYKYALILPVIVLFLYSFNVVEEIEYVENSNSEIAKPLITVTNAKELVFDITSATTNEQLDKYKKQIESQAEYEMRYEDLKRNENGKLTSFSLAIKFPDSKWIKDFMVELDDNSHLSLIAKKDELILNVPKYFMEFKIDKNKIDQGYDAVSKVNLKTASSNSANIKKTSISEDHTLSFKIDATSTKKDLEAIKDLLKEEYNVKFDYSKLKFKNDKIVRLKLSLDDKNGYKATKSDNDTDGIDPMCVTAIVKGDSANWSLGSCEEKAANSFTTYSSSNYLMNGKVDEERVDSLIATINGQFKAYRLDSLQQMVEFDMAQFDLQNLDSLQNIIQMQMSKQNWDSIQTDMNIRFEDLDSITYSIKNIKFTDPQNTFIFRNSFSGLPTTQAEIRRGILTSGENQPLFIIDGKEVSEEEMMSFSPQLIESVSVLKDAKDTSIYGDKAKNGVVIIVTKDDDFAKLGKKAREKAEQKVQLLISRQESKRDSLMEKRIELIDMKRAELEARREAIVLNNKNQIRFLTDSTLTDQQVDELNASGNWFRNEQLTAQQVDELNRTGDFRVYTDLVKGDSSNFILLDVTKKGFEKLEKDLEDAGHSFKLKTHRMKNGKLNKLKYEINGSEYTYVSKTGIKLLKIQFDANGKTPRVSMIPN
ncbi:TonB-dependent SusC/RagA subfamily outer membrane receptor [Nonlabens dokdonensis]|uniref:Peptidase M56, BlaR1 n=2 Tax=Nonlabens dokdonensis TaxID=328515 RepID=L7W574_NONDD|nr:M56 family metallopeptidase [Nonlabens dokdonensis]AGC75249.1 peptidase M56, BlaR1 [Nonlabens dokdonensis DSW-6]PZX39012.1 TonB-dependent SusC/RagA subfamily outer membrane receptor [Nonlabens dokdonensis]